MKSKDEIVRSIIMHTVNPIVILVSALILALMILHIVQIGKQNQTYNRFVTCVLSVPALDRNQTKIDACYTEVQNETGVKIKKY